MKSKPSIKNESKMKEAEIRWNDYDIKKNIPGICHDSVSNVAADE